MSFISGSLGAVLGSEAQDNATEANAANVAATNALNYQMFMEGRGSMGNALLPIYFGKTERNLANDAEGIYNAAVRDAGGYDTQKERYQRLIDQFGDTQQEAANTAKGIFDGSLLNESLSNFAPVGEARVAAAGAQKQSGLEALQDTLNEIKATQAGKGFSGDSFGSTLLRANVRRKTYSDAANALSQANIANASDKFNLQQQAQQRKLASLSIPMQMADQSVAFLNLPQNEILNQTAKRQSLFNWFKMNPGQFQYSPMPTVQPNSAASAAFAGIGSGNAMMANYFLNKNWGSGGGGEYGGGGGWSTTGGEVAAVGDEFE